MLSSIVATPIISIENFDLKKTEFAEQMPPPGIRGSCLGLDSSASFMTGPLVRGGRVEPPHANIVNRPVSEIVSSTTCSSSRPRAEMQLPPT